MNGPCGAWYARKTEKVYRGIAIRNRLLFSNKYTNVSANDKYAT